LTSITTQFYNNINTPICSFERKTVWMMLLGMWSKRFDARSWKRLDSYGILTKNWFDFTPANLTIPVGERGSTAGSQAFLHADHKDVLVGRRYTIHTDKATGRLLIRIIALQLSLEPLRDKLIAAGVYDTGEKKGIVWIHMELA
jgi:hypothetical protein